jgi:hypothetical protein
MGHTRGTRVDAREHSDAVVKTMQRLDEVDRAILDWEYGFPSSGPHLEQVGIGLAEYRARVESMIVNPVAASWATESWAGICARYGPWVAQKEMTRSPIATTGTLESSRIGTW